MNLGDGMPLMSSVEERMARALTNATLAARLDSIRNNRRAFDKTTTDALLEEAARRLRWADAYENHR
jgi:hypothetical protein